MVGKIYLLSEDDSLQELTETQYASEELLQILLEKYPDLLAGDQINSNDPRRWILVSREAGIPGGEDEGNRWAVDHLFLDQDGIPTLVEVKRSNDTRIRREVVGQMLDYAANAIAYWPLERLRTAFESACEARQTEADEVIFDLLGQESDVEEFWMRVKTNLQAGKVRLVFVADVIPRELEQIVEFLNRQMDPTEVLAVEISQFEGDGLRTLVPRVIGQTAEAQAKKGSRPKRQWDYESFTQDLRRRHGEWAVSQFQQIFEWSETRDVVHWYGTGHQDGSWAPVFVVSGREYKPFIVYPYGPTVELQLQHLRSKPPFDQKRVRIELIDRLNGIPDVSISTADVDRRPHIKAPELTEGNRLARFFEIMDWFLSKAGGHV